MINLKPSANHPGVTQNTIDGLQLYIEKRIPPGGFLEAILCNDLVQACARADDFNKIFIHNIVSYCYTYLPSNAWGNKDRVNNWLHGGGNASNQK